MLNCYVIDDTGSAAFKMMAKMGWAPGKGLGVNESGSVDPIKLRLKNDDSGLGYKVSEDDALAQQSEFQSLLLQLNSASNDVEIEADDSKKMLKKPKIKSLEKQSEQSTKRVHYKKFTRGKDLSRASEQDLMSILGISLKKPKVKEPVPEPIAPEPVEEATTIHGANMYITAGSSVDYFKKRSVEKKTKKQSMTPEETICDSTAEESKNGDINKRRSVTWGDVDVSYVDKYIKDMVDTSGSVDESLNHMDCTVKAPAKKKKKKKSKDSQIEVPESLVEESTPVIPDKKKKKKSSGEVSGSVFEKQEPVKTEKKKKKRKFCEDENSTGNLADAQENFIEHKKKKWRINSVDHEVVAEVNTFIDNTESEALIVSEEHNSLVEVTQETKQKKKKKKKHNRVDALPEQPEQAL